MRKSLFFAVVLALPFSVLAHADVENLNIHTTILAVEEAGKAENYFNVLANANGRVYRVDARNEVALAAARIAANLHAPTLIELEAANSDYVRTIVIEAAVPQRKSPRPHVWGRGGYRPTVFDSNKEARNLFDSVDNYKNTDLDDNCYNRAMFWARTFYVRDNIKVQKVFVMFTEKFRNKWNYKWWYHVAPFVLVEGSNGREEVIIDPSFEKGPRDMKSWGVHIADKPTECKDAKNLNDYYSRGKTDECLFIRASMYDYDPNDLYNPGEVEEWRCNALRSVTKSIRPPKGFNSWKEVQGFIPDECR